MSSSTSSFKTEWKVVVSVALVLLAAEVTMRLETSRFSEELRLLGSLPTAGDPHTEPGTRVLILGNSLTRCGIDERVLRDSFLSPEGTPPVRFNKVAFNGTSALEWNRILTRYFIRVGNAPDWLIMPFGTTALQDVRRPDLGRLALLCGPDDFWDTLANDLEPAQFGLYLHSYVFYSFANRSRIRLVVLKNLLPDYATSTIRLWSAQAPGAAGADPPPPSYRMLKQLLAEGASHRIRIALVAMPRDEDYEIDPQIRDAADAAKAILVDMRHVDGIAAEDFTDGIHLSPAGGKKFTRAFVRRLAPLIAPSR
jgi:hypothetical protein